MEIKNKERAFQLVIDILKEKGFKVKRIKYFNKGRHCLIDTESNKYYVLFKHGFFYSFNKQFPQFAKENHSGYGESINKEYLNIAIKNDAYLLFIYEDGKIYLIHSYKVKKIDLVRTQEIQRIYNLPSFSNSREIVNEVTYSFPLNKLIRFY